MSWILNNNILAWTMSSRSVFFYCLHYVLELLFSSVSKVCRLMRIALFGLVLKVWFKSFRPFLVYMLLLLGIGLFQQIFRSLLDGLTTFVFILVFIETQKSGDRWLENLINVNTIYCNWLWFLTSYWGLSINHFCPNLHTSEFRPGMMFCPKTPRRELRLWLMM